MRRRDLFLATAALCIILLIWGISINHPYIHQRARNIQYMFGVRKSTRQSTTTKADPPKCHLSKKCPLDHFAFHITSGAADVVGPNICFEGKTIMSTPMNNVGPGLNVVLVNGENGTVEKFDYLNMLNGNPEDILAYLKAIQPGTIVLVASFEDVATKMTEEMRDIFVSLGSTMITSVKYRDNWVFAGAAGADKEKSPFEKLAVHNMETNIYVDWPGMIEVAGCFPRKI